MEPFNSFFLNCSRSLDFHNNDLQFVTTSGAISNLENRMHGKLMWQKEQHGLFFPSAIQNIRTNLFFKTRPSFHGCIYATVQFYSADIFRVSWKYNDLFKPHLSLS